MKTYKACLAIGLLAVSAAVPQAAAVPSIVTVSNNPDTLSGDNINAQNVANNLVFTSISILAASELRYFPSLDFSTSPFGTPFFDLSSIAPKISILGDLTFGSFGNFFFDSTQIDLAGSFYAGGGLMDATRFLFSNATNVDVLSNNASLQQALALTRSSPGLSTVTAAFGTANSLAFDYDTEMVLSGGLLSGAVAMNNLAARLELHGHDFQLDTGSGFQAIASGPIGATSGQLKGFLDSGDQFTVSFTQSAPDQLSVVASIPEPETYAAMLAGLGMLGFVSLRRRARKIATEFPETRRAAPARRG